MPMSRKALPQNPPDAPAKKKSSEKGPYLTGNVIHGGTIYPAGTKLSDIPFDGEDEDPKARFERLGVTGSKKDAEEATADESDDDDSDDSEE